MVAYPILWYYRRHQKEFRLLGYHLSVPQMPLFRPKNTTGVALGETERRKSPLRLVVLEKLLTSNDALAGLRFLMIRTADPCSCTSNTTTELRP